MQKFLIFFIAIGAAAFIFFSYINVISKSLKNQTQPHRTETQKILAEQSLQIKRLNKDYRDIIDQSKRQIKESSRRLNNDTHQRDLDRTMEQNRRQMKDRRRQMEQLRRELKRR